MLPDEDKEDFLLRVLREEPLLSIKLHKRLQSLSTQSDNAAMNVPRSTIGEIFHETEKLSQQRREVERLKCEEKKLQKLVVLEAE